MTLPVWREKLSASLSAAEAQDKSPHHVHVYAAVLATTRADGRPSARAVFSRGFSLPGSDDTLIFTTDARQGCM